MSKKTSHNPVPSGTKTLHDILPESKQVLTPNTSKSQLKRRIIIKDGAM